MPVSVLDDPDGLGNELAVAISRFASEEPCSLAWTRHSSLILSIELSVVYTYPVRVACSNPGQGRAREVTSDIADTLAQRAANSDQDVPEAALRDFIAANATRRFDIQLALLGPKRQHRWLFISTDAATLLAVSFLTVFS
ncbi:hypothetical protein [Bradyrhizobium sp. MOS003]|uniref:hypothetical protein n=1 Tax=Bradyrhizobium sp. MOS003 TaxID=2133946 RepID=UPI000D12903F|nr:hypothetical protein [Bradyrhizobium sp. MOS003]PSO16269.1 hypothetical protein C7G42_22240 [Bradyrhizobium sp. MOS003]